MPLQGVTSPMRVEIKHPYLIVQNDKQNDSLFHIYNLTDKKLVGVFGRKGQGPGEFTTPWLVQTYLSDLIVEDNHKFHHYEFDSLGHPVQKESMEAQTVVSIVAEAAFINDSIFVVDERYTGPNLYKFNMNSEIPLKKQKDFLGKLDLQYEDLSIQLTENQKLFQKIKSDVRSEKSEELFDARVDERDTIRDQIYEKLYETLGQKFNASLFHESVSDIDDRLGEDPEVFRDRAYQKRIAREMERRKEQPVRLKKKVHNHER